MKLRTVALCTLLMILLAACGSTSFKSTWKDPSAGPVELTGKKILVVATGMPKAVRVNVEASVADELNKLGAQAIASNQFLSPEATKDEAKAKLAAEGYNAAWVIRLTDKSQEVYSTPGTYAPYGPYGSYWGWGGGYGGYYGGSELRTDTNYFVETLVYSVKADKLVWSGLSVTTNPSNVASSSGELARASVDQMKKSGLLN